MTHTILDYANKYEANNNSISMMAKARDMSDIMSSNKKGGKLVSRYDDLSCVDDNNLVSNKFNSGVCA
jgi:hypothetical protein